MSPDLMSVIDHVAPLWAGEAEVVRTYFDSPLRTLASDRLWLRRQCKKEFWDSIHLIDDARGMFMGPVEKLRQGFPLLEKGFDRHEALELAEALYEELHHYVLFADVYDLLMEADSKPMDVHSAPVDDEWAENTVLGEVRQSHRREYGTLGARVCLFTEGGYCALYREGARLLGRGGVDDAIAAACKVVYEDEIEHMKKGILGLDEEGLTPSDWTLFARLTADQMKQRIHMRNAQFAYPLSQERIQEIFQGEIEPIPFEANK